jgi:hypothetical protein
MKISYWTHYFIVNGGGIKLIPEQIEKKKLAAIEFQGDFFSWEGYSLMLP